MTNEGLKVFYHVEHSVICKYCPDHDQCCPFKRISEIIILTDLSKQRCI